jgi:hypothetical protein
MYLRGLTCAHPETAFFSARAFCRQWLRDRRGASAGRIRIRSEEWRRRWSQRSIDIRLFPLGQCGQGCGKRNIRVNRVYLSRERSGPDLSFHPSSGVTVRFSSSPLGASTERTCSRADRGSGTSRKMVTTPRAYRPPRQRPLPDAFRAVSRRRDRSWRNRDISGSPGRGWLEKSKCRASVFMTSTLSSPCDRYGHTTENWWRPCSSYR